MVEGRTHWFTQSKSGWNWGNQVLFREVTWGKKRDKKKKEKKEKRITTKKKEKKKKKQTKKRRRNPKNKIKKRLEGEEGVVDWLRQAVHGGRGLSV